MGFFSERLFHRVRCTPCLLECLSYQRTSSIFVSRFRFFVFVKKTKDSLHSLLLVVELTAIRSYYPKELAIRLFTSILRGFWNWLIFRNWPMNTKQYIIIITVITGIHQLHESLRMLLLMLRSTKGLICYLESKIDQIGFWISKKNHVSALVTIASTTNPKYAPNISPK